MPSIPTLKDGDDHEKQWWEPCDPSTIDRELLKDNEIYVRFDVLIAQDQERRSSCFRVDAKKLFLYPIVAAQLASNANIPPHYVTEELKQEVFNSIHSIGGRRSGAKFLMHFGEGEAELGDHGVRPASNRSINRLEKMAKDEMEGLAAGSGNYSCSICLDELWNGLEGRRMPCKHAFHSSCIVKWLKKSNMCPLCRYEMPKARNYFCPTCRTPFSLGIILGIYY
ncbi:probable E3 ubiquitin-protein ligase RHC1A [Tripterygium wilfordii]|uniref:probable E3 ubiquitin-protein ligase RHC1A n=1 Tax=Tripterygium wilfordii TaxID=458696 RepID=UPI0018F805BC|nr:probable E3 ubiquitin-protein ligase RHC1A [Tripterygium wilfordii]